jgi:dihydrodipicolinate synthase/N-acetylneuraminate lyase
MENPIVPLIRGVFPALPTPFTDDGRVDVKGLENLVTHVVRGGVHGLWVLGSSAEFTSLSPEERKLVVEVTVQAANRRVPVMVGLGSNDVRAVLRNAEEAHSAGADAAFIVLPYYFVTDVAEALVFFRQIAQESPLSVTLYDNPFATKTKLDVAAYLELADCENIIALKDSSSDFVHFERLLDQLPSKTGWKILQGDERLVGASVLYGADGTVAALASVVPALFVQLFEAAKSGDIESTWTLQRKAMALGRLFELKGQPTDGAFFAGLKAGLQVLGICGRAVSSPFSPMPEHEMAAVEKLLAEFL